MCNVPQSSQRSERAIKLHEACSFVCKALGFFDKLNFVWLCEADLMQELSKKKYEDSKFEF